MKNLKYKENLVQAKRILKINLLGL